MHPIRTLATLTAAALTTLFSSTVTRAQSTPAKSPNIIIIYSDDVGYGDVGCYGANKVATPNIDRLASQGLRFTDAHSPSATCTPSRFSLLTGQYAWRQKGTGILPGDASLIIDPAKMTLPRMLQNAGYTTAAVGKWHLGLGTPSAPADWNGDVKPGPLEIGFSSCFIMPATGDRVPCVYLENHRVVNLTPSDPIQVNYDHKVGDEPTGKERPDLLKMQLSHGHADTIVNGISRIGFMAGGKSARWVDEDIADVLTQRAVSFIDANKTKPFFLYLAPHDIHVPRVPNPRFVGKSGCGIRGDAILELDWTVGQIMQALDREGLADNTLLIFSSDNGPVVDDGYADRAEEDLNGHKPSGDFRGRKYTPFEGGTRVPMVLRWPARVKPGTTSDALVCHTDFLASFANLVGQPTPDTARDSANVLPALLGQSATARLHVVEHASRRSGLRSGTWKMTFHNSRLGPNAAAGPDNGGANQELYDLASDPAEQQNVAKEKPEIVTEMTALLEKIKSEGDHTATTP